MNDDLHIGQLLRGEARARKNMLKALEHKHPEVVEDAKYELRMLARIEHKDAFRKAAITSVVPEEGQS